MYQVVLITEYNLCNLSLKIYNTGGTPRKTNVRLFRIPQTLQMTSTSKLVVASPQTPIQFKVTSHPET